MYECTSIEVVSFMGWKAIDFDWNRAKSFLVTAEEGSFSAGAAALGLSQPTLSRQVSALEDELGVSLFERSSRGLHLTTTGEELVQYVKEMAQIASQFSLSATSRSEGIEGKVTITATDITAMYILPKIITGLREHAPGIDIELISTDQTRDLQGREADIAIRASRPTQPELIARKLRQLCGSLYASTDYIDSLGGPITLNKLNQATFVGIDKDSPQVEFLYKYANIVPTRSPIVVDSTLVQWEYVRRGMGIGFMLDAIGDDDPLVERVIPEISPLSVEIWLVVHRELRTSPKLQIVFEYLAKHLS